MIWQKILLIPVRLTEGTEFTNLSNKTKIDLTLLIIFLQSLLQFYFVTKKIIKNWYNT